MRNGTSCARELHAKSSSSCLPGPCPDLGQAGQADDDTLAAMYVRMWSLATGRRLLPGIRPEQLTVDELIDFWADDLSSVAGRHAAPESGATGEGR